MATRVANAVIQQRLDATGRRGPTGPSEYGLTLRRSRWFCVCSETASLHARALFIFGLGKGILACNAVATLNTPVRYLLRRSGSHFLGTWVEGNRASTIVDDLLASLFRRSSNLARLNWVAYCGHGAVSYYVRTFARGPVSGPPVAQLGRITRRTRPRTSLALPAPFS